MCGCIWAPFLYACFLSPPVTNLRTRGQVWRAHKMPRIGRELQEGRQAAPQYLPPSPGCTRTSRPPQALDGPGPQEHSRGTSKLAVGSWGHRLSPGGFQLPSGSAPTNLQPRPARLSVQEDGTSTAQQLRGTQSQKQMPWVQIQTPEHAVWFWGSFLKLYAWNCVQHTVSAAISPLLLDQTGTGRHPVLTEV